MSCDRCKEPAKYLKNLPPTAVIICFHNEAWSVLVRTVHSVLDRSPEHLIQEIILVDDFSNMRKCFHCFLFSFYVRLILSRSFYFPAHLAKQLEDYFLAYPKVKIIRAPKREGLIRARLLGARHATAPVLTYLDSHCECTTGKLFRFHS